MLKYDIILDICNTHSLSATDEKYSYSQPAVSQIVKNFEKELGMQLFTRTKGGMQLLPGTESIISSLRKICYEEDNIKRIASRLTSLENGHIRIGTLQSISYHWLPDILQEFSEEYPNITFEITVGGSKKIQDKLQQNKLDIIFSSDYKLASNVSFYPLGSDELMVLTSRTHPLSEHLSVSIQDIANEEYISDVDKLDFEAGEILDKYGIQPQIRFYMNDDFAVQKMVEAGFGISILPQLLLYHTPFDICVRPFTEHFKRTLGVAFRNDTDISPAVQKLLEYVRNWEEIAVTL